MPSSIEALPWDTGFFGQRIGRLRVEEGRPASRDELIGSGNDCIYIEMGVDGLTHLGGWLAVGARPVDLRVTLDAPCRGTAAEDGEAISELAIWSTQDVEAAIPLAEELSRWSRFAQDPRFAPKAGELYRRWLDHAIAGRHRSLVWRNGGTMGGLLTFITEPDARIELLVIDGRQRSRGVGPRLARAFLSAAAAAGCERATVRTQLRNGAALRAYERAGFVVREVTMILHWWRP